MTDAVLCDRCGKRIDEEWTGPMVRLKNRTGAGGPSTWDLCPECHTEIRDELWTLLGYRDDE